MNRFELIAPCHFGLEAVLKKEIIDLGYDIAKTEDGRITFPGDPEAIVRANMHLRSCERILLKVGEFEARSFEELFQGIKALEWEAFLPANAKFWVTKAVSVKSRLFSPTDIQSVAKKAIVERLKGVYHTEWFPEDGAAYPIRLFLMKDVVTAAIDTTGESLHKRGYRKATAKAPVSETLASALIMLTPWHKDRILVDPFCGSGTFAIEAAMMAANIAPGIARHFLSESWENVIDPKEWKACRVEAREQIDPTVNPDIQGYDIDASVLRSARENAARAGVDHMIHFQQRDIKDLHHPKKYGFIITNPPYGERLGEQEEMKSLYREIGEAYRRLDDWSMYLITGFEDAQKYIGRRADKNRKLYNGMIKTYFYQFLGPKPPKKEHTVCREN